MMLAGAVFRCHEHNLGAGRAHGHQIPWSDCTFSEAASAGKLKEAWVVNTF
jgi:hypothetical protein